MRKILVAVVAVGLMATATMVAEAAEPQIRSAPRGEPCVDLRLNSYLVVEPVDDDGRWELRTFWGLHGDPDELRKIDSVTWTFSLEGRYVYSERTDGGEWVVVEDWDSALEGEPMISPTETTRSVDSEYDISFLGTPGGVPSSWTLPATGTNDDGKDFKYESVEITDVLLHGDVFCSW